MSARTLKLLQMARTSKSCESNNCSIPTSGDNRTDITDLDEIMEVHHEEICKTTHPIVRNDEMLYTVPNVEFDIIDIPEISDSQKKNGLCTENGVEDEVLFSTMLTSNDIQYFNEFENSELSSENRNLDDEIIEEEDQDAQKTQRQDDPEVNTKNSNLDDQIIEEEDQGAEKTKTQDDPQLSSENRHLDDPDWQPGSSSSDEELEENNNLKQQDNTIIEIGLKNKPAEKNRMRRNRRHIDTAFDRKREIGLEY